MTGSPVDHAGQGHLRMSGPHGALAEHPHGGTIAVQVVSPEAILYDGGATSLTVPAFDGLLGILPRHAPMLALLGRGVLKVKASAGEKRFKVGGGFVQVRANVVRVVAEEAAAID